jgi:hypothetical protein
MPVSSRVPKAALVKTFLLAAAIALLILMAPGTLHAATLTLT